MREVTEMLYELRQYQLTSTPMMAHMHARMEQHIFPLFEEHDMHVAGAWEKVIGSSMPAYIWMLQWRDMAHREQSFASFYADPRWVEARRVTTEAAGGEMVQSIDVSFLQPATYSPLQ